MIEYLKISARTATRAVFSGLLLISLNNPALASSAKKKENSNTGGNEWVMPTHIQLVPMMVPVEGRRTAPITLYLAATNKKFVVNICNYAPRIRDAVLNELSRSPVHVKGRKLDLRGVPDKLLKQMNRVVGNKVIGRHQIKKIYVVAGNVRMGAGKISRVPAARIDGCENILRSDLEREKAEAAKKAK